MNVISIGQQRPGNDTVMEQTMNPISATYVAQKPKIWLPILVGGLVAGGLDLIAAFLTYGPGVPRAIAAGLLGRQAIHGSALVYVLGVALQFFIAVSAAAVYYAASRRLYFLTEHFVVCGLFYGIAVFLVMNLIVLPLSALHAKGPYQLASLIQGLLVHMIIIGLPIAFSVRRFSN
jgi:hypothetical protein